LPQAPQLCRSLLALTHSVPHAFCPLAQLIVVGVVLPDCAQLAANSAQPTTKDSQMETAGRVCIFTSECGVCWERYTGSLHTPPTVAELRNVNSERARRGGPTLSGPPDLKPRLDAEQVPRVRQPNAFSLRVGEELI
jgi:hypothetical protein